MLEGRRLPRGRKRVGLKELVWYLDGLNGCAKDIWYFFLTNLISTTMC